jgi:hypothetical protein
MPETNVDPEDDLARLSQEATNQSTPEKSLEDPETAHKPQRPAPQKPPGHVRPS